MSDTAVAGAKAKKVAYVARVTKLFLEYPRILMVCADNVGSKHFQKLRVMMREHSVILMGRNTLIKRALNKLIASGRKEFACLVPHLKGNIGLIFTKASLSAIKKIADTERVPAAAKQGAVAPVDVVVPAGPTGLEPTKTSFLQVCGITSKIIKSQIDIISDTVLVRKGQKVSASASALLELLKKRPFSYGLEPLMAYEEGNLFDPVVLDLSDADLLAKFQSGLSNVAAVSLAADFPTVASVPHSFINGFKNVVAVSLAADYTFDRIKTLKELLDDPTKLAALAAAASAPAAGGEAKKEEEKKVEEEEETTFEGGGLFGGDDEEEW